MLQELADKEARRDELEALFAEVDALEEGEFEEENFEVFPKDVLKELKANEKELKSKLAQLKREQKALNVRIKANEEVAELTKELATNTKEQQQLAKQVDSITKKLAHHNDLATELRGSKATIAEIKKQKEALVEKARESISSAEAEQLILKRWKAVLHDTVMDYVMRYEREILQELEQRFSKYEQQLISILDERSKSAKQLDNYLIELGYEG